MSAQSLSLLFVVFDSILFLLCILVTVEAVTNVPIISYLTLVTKLF